MDKNIYELQNQVQVLQALVVQSKLYSKAKKINCFNFSLCVLLPVVFTFAKPFLESKALIFSGIIIVIASFFVSNRMSKSVLKTQTSAAKVQQTIDFYLFEDNTFRNRNDDWGELYSEDELIELISKTKIENEDIQSKKNWYSDYSSLPHVQQSYYSQRECVRWDVDLRKKFVATVCISIAVLMVAVLAIAIAFKMTVFEIVVNIGMFFPIIKFLYPIREKANNDITRLKGIKYIQVTISNTLGILIGGEELYAKEIQIQKKLYEHRKSAIMIPDFFYRIFRSQQECIEEKIAQNTTKY